jgi:PAS domain S-box-containing protein
LGYNLCHITIMPDKPSHRPERREVDTALKISETRLRLAIEAGRMAVWEVDLLTDTLTGSPEVNRLLGFPPDAEPTLEDLRSRYYPGERERIEAIGRDALARGERFVELEFRFLWPDGSQRWLLLRTEVQLDPAGHPVKAVGVVMDITARKRAEAALQRSEAELKLITDSLPELICFIDRDQIYRFANKAYESWWGRTPDQVVGRHVREIVGEEGYELRRPHIEAALAGQECRLDVAVAQPNGRDRLGEVRYLPRLDAQGKVDGFYAFVIDVTRRKRAEEALQRLNETLESEVEARTRDLRAAEEALRQSQKMEAVGQLTGGIAHDFNNILAAISGSLDFIKRRIAAGRVQEVGKYLDAAVAASNRAAALTQRLLAFARRQSLESKPVDVNGLVSSLRHLLRRTTGGSITIETSLAPDAGMAMTDAAQLETTLLNLAINARDAMPDGGHLSIETERLRFDKGGQGHPAELATGDYVVLRVADTGEGMTAEVLSRAFDPFFTTKPIGQGTGLGLSMVYGFAKQTGGHVRIQSSPGEGTTVWLYLPRHSDGEGALHGPGGSVEVPRAEAGETVLVVEDERAVRTLVVEILRELGYEALEADSARSALHPLEADGRIDLLLTDVGLPGINGRQLAEMAREHRPNLPVLFITGYAQGAAARDGFLGPGMDLIAKPFALDELGARIRAMIARARRD